MRFRKNGSRTMTSKALYACSVLIAAFSAAVISTYSRLSVTADEPAHLAAGMEYLQTGEYLYETQHPPLARIMAAVGPYFFLGDRFPLTTGMWDESRRYFRDAPSYERSAAAMRMGVLPFYIVLLGVCAAWGYRAAQGTGAVLAVIITGFLPTLTGHAGLAATDAPSAATILLALFAFLLWLNQPRFFTALFVSVATTLAVATKFSSLLFFPVGAAGLVVAFIASRMTLPSLRAWARFLGTCVLTSPLLLWAVYGFETATLKNIAPGGIFENYFHDTTFSPFIESLLRRPLPLGQFVRGVAAVGLHNSYGHQNYFMGEIGATGWWTFFPVMLFYKAPLAFSGSLVLALAAWLVRRKGSDAVASAPLFAGLSILAASIFGSINLGTRHVLIVYPLLAVFTAIQLSKLLDRRRAPLSIFVALLLCGQAWDWARSYPDFIGYFNAAAPDDRSELVTDSDLEWGQYNYALRAKLDELGVESFYSDLFSRSEMDDRFFPHAISYEKHPRARGWIVIHRQCIRLNRPWCLRLTDNTPVATVGNSILIYHLKPKRPRSG